ncbi:MAG: class I SAM-dependent methyltransferase [Syntrophales bacterium]
MSDTPSMNKHDHRPGGGLRNFILAQIREGGPVPFARFMEWCLYHPDYGYYHSEGTKTGKGGDYYTAPCVHPLFGRMVARQLMQMSALMGTGRFTVVETGAGRGFLCRDILDWARRSAPEFYRGLDYRLLDVSRRRVEEQKETLALHAREGKVSWGEAGELAEGGQPVEGCFLSNELVDAFPVHRVILQGGKLREIYVGEHDGGFVEVPGDLSSPEIGAYFAGDGIILDEGQKAEVNLRARQWMRSVGSRLRRGFVLTIDYGCLAGELYAPWRRSGTIRGYFRHGFAEDPYERVGEQDLTAHVNFSALIGAGQAAGLSFTGLVPQYRFLIGLGLLDEMDEAARGMSAVDALKMRLSLKHLIAPETGMGEIFKVLIQHKGVGEPRLDGLRGFDSIPAPC